MCALLVIDIISRGAAALTAVVLKHPIPAKPRPSFSSPAHDSGSFKMPQNFSHPHACRSTPLFSVMKARQSTVHMDHYDYPNKDNQVGYVCWHHSPAYKTCLLFTTGRDRWEMGLPGKAQPPAPHPLLQVVAAEMGRPGRHAIPAPGAPDTKDVLTHQ